MTLPGTGISAFCSCRMLREAQQEKLSKLVNKALDTLGECLEHENEQVRLMAALYLLRMPATQANLKSNATMEMKSRYQGVERKIKSAAEQTGLGE